ncbi:MAG TPA: alcohol dehydrogenase catalytic domain-containing protein [Acidobacteriaceae bacterium]|jgi:threonine dehydrogenase-like Zn-dependent dehydrogenase|nr:alcohol dehydrogenase catalytic domain-containing protein [Acidobacteriaceae bacterium]
MRGTVLYGPRDVRFEECATPKVLKPTDAIIRISATCVCGSDLWSYRGIGPVDQPTPMGHDYCGIVGTKRRFGRGRKRSSPPA